MVKNLFNKSKNLVLSPQSSILSAALVIMVMIIGSRVLGLVRQRVLAHFFTPNDLSLFFAAFRLPDLIFEVFVFGTFSSAFIPVFTKTLRRNEKEAWQLAQKVINIGIGLFSILAIVFMFTADKLYSVITPGFSPEDIKKIANIAKILIFAQGFFVISYIVTGVLESLKHFLIPALAPIFYNIGIILGTILLVNNFSLAAPALGVVIGALLHLAIQLPLAFKLGMRYKPDYQVTPEVKEIAKLSAPRFLDLGFQQASKTIELYFASIVSQASYTYFMFATSLQALPVGLFGVSLAKAALPSLARNDDDKKEFSRLFLSTLYQMVFLTLPLSAMLIVLRVPAVRLAFGAKSFDWDSTIQTGFVVTAFAVGIPFQSVVALLNRAFYALHDTKTPVIISILSAFLIAIGDAVLVGILGLSVWSLAFSYSIGVSIQAVILYIMLNKKINGKHMLQNLIPVYKPILGSIASGLVMFFILKFFDRSVWVKRLSFANLEALKNVQFQNFVLDTRYTSNLIVLTVLTAIIGLFVYLLVNFLLKSKELSLISSLVARKIKNIAFKDKPKEIISNPKEINP